MAKWRRQIEFGFSSFRASSFLTIHLSTTSSVPEAPYHAVTPGLGRFEIIDRRLIDPAMSEEESWTKAEEYAFGELVAYWADQMRALDEAVGEAAEAVRVLGGAAGEVAESIRALSTNMDGLAAAIPSGATAIACPVCGEMPIEGLRKTGNWRVRCSTPGHPCIGRGEDRAVAIKRWNEDVELRL